MKILRSYDIDEPIEADDLDLRVQNFDKNNDRNVYDHMTFSKVLKDIPGIHKSRNRLRNFLETSYVNDTLIKVLGEKDTGRYLIREELHGLNHLHEDNVTLLSCYTYEGYYIGDEKMAEMLYDKGIYPQFIDYDSNVCSVGLSIREQKWYGWSHRAMYGFGVGDIVRKGDCAYMVKDKQDLEDWMIAFWTDNAFKYEITHDAPDPYNEKGRGVSIKTWSKQKGTGRTLTFDHQQPYPKKWGRGSYTIHTLKEAKETAINFARSVS